MKKQMSVFVWAIGLLGITPAIAETNWGARAASSADLTNMPAVRTRDNVDYTKYETRTTTRTYNVQDANNLYYTQPVKRSELYKQYDNSAQSAYAQKNVRTSRAETVRSELRRKYFLAHPFFQPVKGKFGSITDFSYDMSSYKMAINPLPQVTVGGVAYNNDISDKNGKWDMKQFTIKEDFSYGITDRIAVMAMLEYDSSKYKLDWENPATIDDEISDSGLNLYGIGGQFRFIDNADWIATASAYFQHQKDVANDFVLDLKAGYKVSSTTIYGLARAWYVDFDGTSYGNSMIGTTADGNTAGLFLAYKTNTSDAFYIEGGLGVFSVLEEDWTLNAEAILGNYDWHNQARLKAAIGWQPNDWFALNLYAETAVYDSADDKNVEYYGYNVRLLPQGAAAGTEPTLLSGWLKQGDAKLSDNKETKIGLQAIFMF